MALSKRELARRLRAAREACHMRQEDVADHLGVSRSVIAQMELGNRAVTSLELDKLANLYGRDIREFLADEFREADALVALFRAHHEVAEQEETLQALRKAMALGRELTNLERMLGLDRDAASVPGHAPRAVQTKWQAVQQGERLAMEERRRLELGGGPLANVAELLESQGIRTARLHLPEDVSGLTLFDEDVGAFVVVNERLPGHTYERRRFSYAHEYCHVLVDHTRRGTISRTSDHDSLLEVRANAFASAFLMPRTGVEEFVYALGKGQAGRPQVDVYDEESAHRIRGRTEPGSQEIQLHDVVLLAHHFGVSRIAALYRLKNLQLLTQAEFEALKKQDEQGLGKALTRLLDLRETEHEDVPDDFRHRFMALALEAYRRGEITRGKLRELAEMVHVHTDELNEVLTGSGVPGTDARSDEFPSQE